MSNSGKTIGLGIGQTRFKKIVIMREYNIIIGHVGSSGFANQDSRFVKRFVENKEGFRFSQESFFNIFFKTFFYGFVDKNNRITK